MTLREIWYWDERASFQDISQITQACPSAGMILMLLLRVTGPGMRKRVAKDEEGYLTLSNEFLAKAKLKFARSTKRRALKFLESAGDIAVKRFAHAAPKVRLLLELEKSEADSVEAARWRLSNYYVRNPAVLESEGVTHREKMRQALGSELGDRYTQD